MIKHYTLLSCNFCFCRPVTSYKVVLYVFAGFYGVVLCAIPIPSNNIPNVLAGSDVLYDLIDGIFLLGVVGRTIAHCVFAFGDWVATWRG